MRLHIVRVSLWLLAALTIVACGGHGGSSATSPAPTVTLTSAVPDAAVNVPFLLIWSSSNATACTASGAWSGSVATSGTQSVTAMHDETYGITCTGRGGSATASVAVRAWSGLPSASISVDRLWVLPNETVRVTWTSVNALHCVGMRGLSGELLPSGSQTSAPLAETTTFEVTCANPNGSYDARVVVNVGVAPTPTATLTSSRYDVPDNEQNIVTLEWSSTNMASCVASGAWSGALAPSGSQRVAVTQTSDYVISCANNGGVATANVTVRSWARPEVSLVADPTQVSPDSVTLLTWSSPNATTCTGYAGATITMPGWSGPLPTSGSTRTLPLTETTRFSIFCTNPGYESVNSGMSTNVLVGVGVPKYSGVVLPTFHVGNLNDAGDVVGWQGGQVGPGVYISTAAKMWIGGAFSKLPGCAGARFGYAGNACAALDINDRGQVVGWWQEFPDGSPRDQTGFRYEGGVVTLIPFFRVANGINTAGQIVGSIVVKEGDLSWTHAAVYKDGNVIDLGTLEGGASEALAINDAGVVVGWADTPAGRHAFRYANGAMTDLGTLGGATSVASGINSAGTIVGAADRADGSRRAFMLTGSGMIDLGTLGGFSSEALAINDAGQVVGWSFTNTGQRAFVFSDGAMHNLNGYLSPPLLEEGGYGFYLLRAARGINGSGQIVADAYVGRSLPGGDVVVLLTPLAR
jgi:probable HAF family extracellular repeat protein